MKKGVNKSEGKSYNNRLLYSLIALGVVLVIAVGVYAATGSAPTGPIPNPGHPLSEIQACGTAGDILQTNSTGNGWDCVASSSVQSLTSSSNVNLSLSSASLGSAGAAYGNISLGYPNDMAFDGGNDGQFIFQNRNGSGTTTFKIGSTDVFDIKSSGVYVGSGLGYYYSSDRRLKTNIQPLQNSLQKIEQIQGVSFNWKSNGAPEIGVIAQNVQQVYPSLVSDKGENGTLAVNYIGLIGPLIESIKTQQQEINDLQNQINNLQSQINTLKK